MHIGLEVHFPLMGHAGGHVTETGTPTKDWQGPPSKKGARGELPRLGAGWTRQIAAGRRWSRRRVSQSAVVHHRAACGRVTASPDPAINFFLGTNVRRILT